MLLHVHWHCRSFLNTCNAFTVMNDTLFSILLNCPNSINIRQNIKLNVLKLRQSICTGCTYVFQSHSNQQEVLEKMFFLTIYTVQFKPLTIFQCLLNPYRTFWSLTMRSDSQHMKLIFGILVKISKIFS